MKAELEVTHIFETIEKIADKIGLTAKELWPYLVRQEIIQALMILITCVIGCAVSLYVRKVYGGKFSAWEHANDTQKPLSIIPIVVIVIFIIVGLVHLHHLFNPEFYAFKEFVSILKK